jgi:serine/threonine protein kinase
MRKLRNDLSRVDEDFYKTLQLFIPYVKQLAAFHRAGYVHGDIKEKNLMIAQDDAKVIIDFGNAFRGLSAVVGGSPGYAAPEKYKTAMSDIYSMAITIANKMKIKMDKDANNNLTFDFSRSKVPEKFREPFELLLQEMTKIVPAERISADVVLTRLQEFLERDASLTFEWRYR